MDSHIEILKSLIDSLTVQLTNILIKIEAIHPILNRLLDENQLEAKNSTDALERLKDLQKDFNLYQNGFQQLQQIPQLIKEAGEVKEELETIKKLLAPVNKYSRMMMKPLSVALFVIVTSGALMGIVEAVKYFIGK